MKKVLYFFFIITCWANAQGTLYLTDSDIKAYPGCIGHGCNSTGARNTNNTYLVTNTSDSGAGSFRQMSSDFTTDATGGYVIFRTGGLNEWTTSLYIGDQTGTVGGMYLAGQTAPGGGYALRQVDATGGRNLEIRGSDMVVRFMRFYGGSGGETDGLKIGDNNLNYTMSDLVFDHNTFGGAEDEGVSIATKNASEYADPSALITNVSFTNNLIGAQTGPHYSLIVYGDNVENLSIINNLMTNNAERQVLINGTDNTVEFINNYVYNWKEAFSILVRGKFSAIGNAYRQGNIGDASFATFRLNDCLANNCGVLDQNYTGSQAYLEDNLDDTNAGGLADTDGDVATYTVGARIISSGYTPTAASALLVKLDDYVGAGYGPSGYDTFESAQITNAQSDTGARITTFTPPTLAAGTPYTDTDGDGLSDAYELAQGGTATAVNPYENPATATLTDGRVIDQTGVTNYATNGYEHMEIFLAELAGDWDGFTFVTGNEINAVNLSGRMRTGSGSKVIVN